MPRKITDYFKKRTTRTNTRRRPYRKRRGINRTVKPMKSLGGYRNMAMYRFFRETVPTVVNPTIIPSSPAGEPTIGYLDFDNFKMEQLVNFANDFGALFARYKIDKIITYLTPMFSDVVSDAYYSHTANINTSSNCKITKVNTKWLNNPFVVASTAMDQRIALAQQQSKTVKMYASKKPLVLITYNPGTYNFVSDDPSTSNTSIVREKGRWLNVSTDSNVVIPHNSMVFIEKIDGTSIDSDFKYYMQHKVYFRCSQVG